MFGNLNNTTAYLATRAKSRAEWALIRYGLAARTQIKNWGLVANLKGQYTDEPLIGGEQFGIGGAYSVRGYNEREANIDIGNTLSLELYAPSWKDIIVLGFFDYGKGRNLETLNSGLDEKVKLNSAGLGVRWQWQNNIKISIDIAHTLSAFGETENNNNHAHANLLVQF